MVQGRGGAGTLSTGAGWLPTRGDRVQLGKQTAELLGALGPDATTIAGSLADAGVRGQPADARQCALAVYLRAVMEGDPRVTTLRVFHDRVVVGSPGRVRPRRVVVTLPAALRAFVAGFDAQRYPALVRRRIVRTPSCSGNVPAGADAPAGHASAS